MKSKIKCKICGDILTINKNMISCRCGNINVIEKRILFGINNELEFKYCCEELNKQGNNNYDVIFRYRYYPAREFLDFTPEGFEVIIYNCRDDYNLIYRKINYSNKNLDIIKYFIPYEYIGNIIKIIDNSNNLFYIPRRLNNGSNDCYKNEFYFNNLKKDKIITSWNIEVSDMPERDIPEEYLDIYLETYKNEKEIIKTFKKISKELKKIGISLTLNSFSSIKYDKTKLF